MTSSSLHFPVDNGTGGGADDWPPGTVEVATGARLHFGLLTHRPESGREFGGLGVMIDSPGWTVRVAHSAGEDEIDLSSNVFAACPGLDVKCRAVLNRWRSTGEACVGKSLIGKSCIGDAGQSAYRIGIRTVIPSHRGLGSGTQLALALARAMDLLESDSRADEVETVGVEMPKLARRSGRGLRSAVGTWGFDLGGLIVDGGKRPQDDVGTKISRIAFPDEWRFVLIAPGSGSGISGDAEVAAFRDLPGMTTDATRNLTAIAMMLLLPAVRDADFDEFSRALTAYGHISGEYFAPAQGGVFACSRMTGIAASLATEGITGFVQTSWGPTCAALCRSIDEATLTAERLRNDLHDSGFEIQIAAPMNRGADVRRL